MKAGNIVLMFWAGRKTTFTFEITTSLIFASVMGPKAGLLLCNHDRGVQLMHLLCLDPSIALLWLVPSLSALYTRLKV